jgi:hypothetical protein
MPPQLNCPAARHLHTAADMRRAMLLLIGAGALMQAACSQLLVGTGACAAGSGLAAASQSLASGNGLSALAVGGVVGGVALMAAGAHAAHDQPSPTYSNTPDPERNRQERVTGCGSVVPPPIR